MRTQEEEEIFCFRLGFLSYEAALYSTVLTEASLFGAQKRAVRQAEGPLSDKVEEEKKKYNSFIQLFGPDI